MSDEAAPPLRVVGIDVLDDILAIARTTVAAGGLAERVTLRRQDVAALTVVGSAAREEPAARDLDIGVASCAPCAGRSTGSVQRVADRNG